MKKARSYFLLLLFVCAAGQWLLAQNKTLDSLLNAVKLAKNDTTRCFLLNVIVESYAEESIWAKYNIEMKDLAEKNLKDPGLKDSISKKTFLKYLSAALNNSGYLSD